MPRIPNNIKPSILNALKAEVLLAFNRPLKRSTDCDRLATTVSLKTGNIINGITFKRLFGFTKYPFNPSIQTLDILSQYIGRKNWYQFESSFESIQNVSYSELDLIKSIFEFDFINEVKNYEGGIQSVSRNIALRLRNSPNAFFSVIEDLAKNPNARTFLIEHFPDYDNLINFYHVAFEHYLKYDKNSEAQIFGNSLLFLKCFWSDDEKGCTKHIKKINKTSFPAKTHPFVTGRFFACNLLYSFFYSKNNLDHLVTQAFKSAQRITPQGKHFKDFPAFHYIVSEALLHCGMYDEVIAMVDSAFSRFPLKMEFVRKGYYRQLQMFKAAAMLELGNKEGASILLSKVNPQNFYFISQKYYTVLFLIFKQKLDPNQFQREEALRISREMNNTFLMNKIR